MRLIIFICCIFCSLIQALPQTLPASRSVNWTIAGLRDTTSAGFTEIDMGSAGVVGDGLTPNDSVVASVLSIVSGPGAILQFPAGDFLFNHTINLPSNINIRGQSAENTTFTMSLGGTGHAINITGTSITTDTSSIKESATKDCIYILVNDPVIFTIGDWIEIIENDSDLISSSWAIHTVGQIVRIDTIIDSMIRLVSPLRKDFDISRKPLIRKFNPAKNTSIECLKIVRTDNTAPEQSSNIHLKYAVDCRVSGIESENCNFSHIEAEYCSNLYISKSYIHHSFDYGEGGRGYGVIFHFTTNESRVEDNVFEHLRHSMILQAGANGNVFAYNYSFDPYWSSIPSNAAGDIVLHGNYPYFNLFEQNICQNIVIDNSHGPNGPNNTFLRNRGESYGIFFSSTNSPGQNFLGNEITNTSFPYNLINYTIQGTGHFLHGNNNKGTIVPSGTQILPDSSYSYSTRPEFVATSQWAAIGTPNVIGTASIPARDRYLSGSVFSTSCGNGAVEAGENQAYEDGIVLYPNPVSTLITIESTFSIKYIHIINKLGELIYSDMNAGQKCIINTKMWQEGIFHIIIYSQDGKLRTKTVLKIR